MGEKGLPGPLQAGLFVGGGTGQGIAAIQPECRGVVGLVQAQAASGGWQHGPHGSEQLANHPPQGALRRHGCRRSDALPPAAALVPRGL